MTISTRVRLLILAWGLAPGGVLLSQTFGSIDGAVTIGSGFLENL